MRASVCTRDDAGASSSSLPSPPLPAGPPWYCLPSSGLCLVLGLGRSPVMAPSDVILKVHVFQRFLEHPSTQFLGLIHTFTLPKIDILEPNPTPPRPLLDTHSTQAYPSYGDRPTALLPPTPPNRRCVGLTQRPTSLALRNPASLEFRIAKRHHRASRLLPAYIILLCTLRAEPS